MGRAPCCDKGNVKKGPWSPEEDVKLKTFIDKYGTGGNWIALPQKIGLKRCGKSCRLRWLNYLRPNIKHGGFSEEEDKIICNLFISIGSRWSIIAAQLPGRTDNDIKNYWNTRLKKKLLGRRKQHSISNTLPSDQNTEEYIKQQLSNSALERLQLHTQLQALQNPLTFFNNSALWEKNMAQTEPLYQNPNLEFGHAQKASYFEPPIEDYAKISCLKLEEFENSVNCMLPYAGKIAAVPSLTGFGPEDIGAVHQKEVSFMEQEDEGAKGLDFIKEMSESKDSIIWSWSNDLDIKSASLNFWDTTSALPSEGMFQDYELLGNYNL